MDVEFVSEGGDMHGGPYCLVLLAHSSVIALA